MITAFTKITTVPVLLMMALLVTSVVALEQGEPEQEPQFLRRSLQLTTDPVVVATGYTEFVGETWSECIADNGLSSVFLCPSVVAFESAIVGLGAALLLVLTLAGGGI